MIKFIPKQGKHCITVDKLATIELRHQQSWCWPGSHRIFSSHYNDVIMSMMASQITSLTVVCLIVYTSADQREHQSSASLAFVWGIHRELPAQMASNAENVSIWWRHHEFTSSQWQRSFYLKSYCSESQPRFIPAGHIQHTILSLLWAGTFMRHFASTCLVCHTSWEKYLKFENSRFQIAEAFQSLLCDGRPDAVVNKSRTCWATIVISYLFL